jgi:hypothetical protein
MTGTQWLGCYHLSLCTLVFTLFEVLEDISFLAPRVVPYIFLHGFYLLNEVKLVFLRQVVKVELNFLLGYHLVIAHRVFICE